MAWSSVEVTFSAQGASLGPRVEGGRGQVRRVQRDHGGHQGDFGEMSREMGTGAGSGGLSAGDERWRLGNRWAGGKVCGLTARKDAPPWAAEGQVSGRS